MLEWWMLIFDKFLFPFGPHSCRFALHWHYGRVIFTTVINAEWAVAVEN